MSDQPRRSFLKLCIHGMGALFTAILGIPAVAYLIDARNRPPRKAGFRPVDGIRLTELLQGQPRQGVIRDVRQDAWTLHPNDVVGRVWVVRQGTRTSDVRVFTTICPHLGCSINCNADASFTCPCHGAEFTEQGTLVSRPGHNNPAPRDMDTLEFQVDPNNPDLLLVDYKNFRQGAHEKIAKT